MKPTNGLMPKCCITPCYMEVSMQVLYAQLIIQNAANPKQGCRFSWSAVGVPGGPNIFLCPTQFNQLHKHLVAQVKAWIFTDLQHPLESTARWLAKAGSHMIMTHISPRLSCQATARREADPKKRGSPQLLLQATQVLAPNDMRHGKLAASLQKRLAPCLF